MTKEQFLIEMDKAVKSKDFNRIYELNKNFKWEWLDQKEPKT